MIVSLARTMVALAVVIALPASVIAQTPVTAAQDTAATSPKPPAPSVDFSGTLFANYQYRGDRGPTKSANRFDLERAYLTFRMPAGERAGIRITTDVFQQTTTGSDAYYRGWSVRAKYAYLQYNYLAGSEWRANARIGLLQTVFIEHDEIFWPRWISPSPTDRAGYLSSADAGIATTVTLPRKLGEVYATVTNGPGYTSREVDRFKDYAARLTLTPWLREPGLLKTLDFSVWAYKGATASTFAGGGAGQTGPVGSALKRDRWGVHAGSLTPRLTAAIQYASRIEEGETGANTVASPRNLKDSTGTLFSAYALARPFRSSGAKPHPLSLLARYDRVTVNTDGDRSYAVIIAGLVWDLTSKAAFSVDYQENNPVSGSPIASSKTWFAHFVARF
jgi:hypothetical protein